jgi:predicted RNA binding protein YcfA (HicA-like mRNA interferase family)
MSAKKELKEIQKAAEEQGWRVKNLRSGHKMLMAPDGVNKVTAPGTPSAKSSIDHLLAELRRYGFQWKGR